MKNSLALIVAAALLCSCSKGDGTDAAAIPSHAPLGAPITFSTSCPQTKGIETVDLSVLTSDFDGFRVAGLTGSTSAVLFNEKAAWSEDEACFLTEGVYYFPSGEETMDFHAVFPSKELTVYEGDVSIASYDCDGVEDLVAAYSTGVASTSSPVPLVFEHILSGLSINCVGTDQAVIFELLEGSVSFGACGTYVFGSGWMDITGLSSDFDAVSEIGGDEDSPTSLFPERTVIPDVFSITLKWRCLTSDASHTVVGEYEVTRDGTLEAGKKNTVLCRLSNDAALPVSFTIEVKPWIDVETVIDF